MPASRRRPSVPATMPMAPAGRDDGDTKARILDAAFRCLVTRGYASLTVRDIAHDAGVNHALISYHFGGKDKLVIAVLDEMNRRLLTRQRAMYAAPGGFAEKWAAARRFYEEDVASGFVRVQAELYAASFSNEQLREQFLPRVGAWKEVVLDAVKEALAAHHPVLPPAFTAEAIASLISEFWLGMEFARLIGGEIEHARHEQALDAIASLLVALERLPRHGGLAPTELASVPRPKNNGSNGSGSTHARRKRAR